LLMFYLIETFVLVLGVSVFFKERALAAEKQKRPRKPRPAPEPISAAK
jgi:hypothetical protein